ncbi:class I SAM-dependent DNA methyltransferase [Phycicoccus avicenniae]|uniref:class I SAM-dependent DNA methyltransferase n=1 Tax=Phycicoccus avicenniae TaxID=2828860 RepID=UPI003D28B822
MSDRDPSSASYRDEFAADDLARQYDAREYGPTSWSTLLWQLEQRTLDELLGASTFVPRRERYLDFACGTGRVLSFVAPHFETAAGVDISTAMLEQAKARVPDARLEAADVTATPDVVGGDYDLVTSFRFLLNADARDRVPALRWMRDRLRDGSGRVVVNNHSNLWSHKAVTHGLRRVRGGGERLTGNVLSHREVQQMVEQAGLRVESVHGLGFLGGQALRVIPFGPMARIQEALRQKPLLEKVGEDQIYVLAPR